MPTTRTDLSQIVRSRGWFLDRVDVDPVTGCWIWRGKKTKRGYGIVEVTRCGRRFATTAHRLALYSLVGPFALELEVDHECRVTSCANPAHLRPMTGRQNKLIGTGFTATKAQQDQCVNGHGFTAANTRVRPNGTRQCRRCDADRQVRKYHLGKAG